MSFFAINKLLLGSLFRKPYTTKYPFEPKQHVKGSRGSIEIEIEKCIFCTLCAKKCPTNALEVDREKKTWTIDRMRCITCGACVDVCPKKCLIMDSCYMEPKQIQGRETYPSA